MSAETVIVTGFGRCGTTMLMQMLHAGGMPVVADSTVSFECKEFERPSAGMNWQRFAGTAIKILDPQRWLFKGTHTLRFIFLTRDPKEQAKSQVKFLSAVGITPKPGYRQHLTASLRRDYRNVDAVLWPHPSLRLSFEQVLANPARAAWLIEQFLGLGIGLDTAAMEAVVLKRSPKCLPDLSHEERMIHAEAATRARPQNESA